MKLFVAAVVVLVVAVCFCFGAGGGPVSFRAVKGEGGPVSFGVWWCRRLFLFWWGEGGQSALEFGGVVVAVAVVVAVVVAVCFCFGGGKGASQLPGCEGGRGASQLWSLVVSPSVFVLVGGRGPVSFRAVKGEGGASQLWSLVVSSSSPSSPSLCCLFLFWWGEGGQSASGVRSNGLCPQSVFAAGGLVPVGFKHSWLSTSHYLLEKLCDGDSLRVRGARAPARRRERG